MMSKSSFKSLSRSDRRAVRVARITSDAHRQQVNLRFVNRARNFFNRINLPFTVVPSYQADPPGAFFQGCWIASGQLWFCPRRVDVGELLHEAAHLLLIPRYQWHLIAPGDLNVEIPLGPFAPIGDAAVEALGYAIALAADIPELAVFSQGFQGNGWRVWETFEKKQHPGFALLRFLGMSQEWGCVTRYFIRDACVEPGDEIGAKLLATCSQIERKAILAFCQKILEAGTDG